MSLYLLVVLVGLLLKVFVARRFYANFPTEYKKIRQELNVFFSVFIASSVINVFIFMPIESLTLFHMPVDLAARLYYLFDNLSTLVGAYLLLGIFGSRLHKLKSVLVVMLTYILIASYSVLFTNTHFNGLVINEHVFLAKRVLESSYILIPQVLAILTLMVVLIALIRTYRHAKTNQSQIRNFYTLIAFVLFDLSYISSLWIGVDSPMILATRGFFFFFVVSLTLMSNDFFDIRHITPKTSENDASIALFRLFRLYSNEKIGHKEAVKDIEKIMVEYKLTKISGFKDEEGSAMPIVADSMKISRSGLYDVLKRLGITTHKK